MPQSHDDWLKQIQEYSPITDAQRAELQRVVDEAERRKRLGLPFDNDFLQAIADAFRGPLLTIRRGMKRADG